MNSVRYFLLLTPLLWVLGCGDDDPTKPGSTAATRDDVAEQWSAALNDLDPQDYVSLLHENYHFEFLEYQADLAQTLDGRWDRSIESATMGRLFDGTTGAGGDAVALIDAELIPNSGDWTESTEEGLEGSWRRVFTLQLGVTFANDDYLQFTSQQELFVTQADRNWKLLHWRELGIPFRGGSAPTLTLGGLKADFADDIPADLDDPDNLPGYLARALRVRDADLYAELLHDDFELQFPADEYDLAGTIDGRWDAAWDVSSTSAMLNGEPSKEGRVILGIDISLTPKDLIWSDVVKPEFEGSLRRTYTIQMDVEVSGNLTYQVRGEQEFYVQQVDGEWRLRFLRDLGVLAKSSAGDSQSMSAVKSLWLPSEFLGTPDDVIENLARAYLQRDIDEYFYLQHPDFQFQFPADEFDLAGTVNGRWDASRDRQSTEKMLSGEPNKDGRVLQNIELTLTPKDLIWSEDVEPEFEGSLRRTYTVQMDVEVSGNLTYQVRGEQEFYVEQIHVNGVLQWKLLFWRDLGVLAKRANESNSLGAMKSLW